MRTAVSLVLVMGVATGCGNNKEHADRVDAGPRVDARPDAAPNPWWSPVIGETKNWDIQTSGTLDLATPRDMFILELFAAVPAETTLDHGDGDPVTVPAGANATAIATLRAAGTKVVCRVGTGAIRLSDPDARKFAGYDADPANLPNDPDAPAAGSVLGWSTTPTDLDERWLDLNARTAWQPLIFARFALAKAIGCDAIEPYLSDINSNATGFTTDLPTVTAWQEGIATEVHTKHSLSVGLRNGGNVGLIDELKEEFDWLLIERCAEINDCDTVRPFITARKAVFAIDYTTNVEGGTQTTSVLCDRQYNNGMIEEGLVKDAALSSAVREQCVP